MSLSSVLGSFCHQLPTQPNLCPCKIYVCSYLCILFEETQLGKSFYLFHIVALFIVQVAVCHKAIHSVKCYSAKRSMWQSHVAFLLVSLILTISCHFRRALCQNAVVTFDVEVAKMLLWNSAKWEAYISHITEIRGLLHKQRMWHVSIHRSKHWPFSALTNVNKF